MRKRLPRDHPAIQNDFLNGIGVQLIGIEYLASTTTEAARMLFLAGTLDRLIFKYSKRPDDLVEAGFKLVDLLPSEGIIDLRTERLNHVLRDAEMRLGYSGRLTQLRAWLPSWEMLTFRCNLRVRVDASGDRAKLLPAEVLAAVFRYELPELSSIDVAAPSSSEFVRSSNTFFKEKWAGQIALIDSGKIIVPDDYAWQSSERRGRFVTSEDIARGRENRSEGNADLYSLREPFDYEVGLAIVTSTDSKQDPLNAFLSQSDPVRAPAAIFVHHEPQRLSVTAPLLDAVMERSHLMVAAIVPSEGSQVGDLSFVQNLAYRYRDISGLTELISDVGRSSMNLRRGRGVANSGLSDWLWAPLIRSRPLDYAGIDLIDPRKYLDNLIGDQYENYEHVFAQKAAADAVARHGITQIDELIRLRKESEHRYMQLQVYDLLMADGEDDVSGKISVLRASSDYIAHIYLDSMWAAAAIAETRFPSIKGYAKAGIDEELEVVFRPLFFETGTTFSQGKIDKILVPKFGPSSVAHFRFSTPSDLRKFRVRIVIRHRTAVLQTLIFALEPLAGDPMIGIPYRLVVESSVALPTDPPRSEATHFDLSLILNDSHTAQPGVLSIQDQHAVFVEPTDWRDLISNIQDVLQTLTCPEGDVFPDLFEGTVVDRLRELALYGSVALNAFRKQAPGLNMSSAMNVQVVEAVSGAFFPVEFFYDGAAPSDEAMLCAHAVETLNAGKCSESCIDGATEDVICPISFWGLSRRIERQTNRNQANNAAITIPRNFEAAPRALRTALVGASVKVNGRDLESLHAILSENMTSVFCAAQWSEWKATLAECRPDLLVLLPHTARLPQYPAIPALEIGSSHLAYPRMSHECVVSPSAPPPLLLLLGCGTASPRHLRFMNFATRFWELGASTVLATLSSVFGHHVSAFAGELAQAIAKAASGSEPIDFGTILLTLKREMLADGNVLALTLICYGDTSWHLDKAYEKCSN